MICLLACVCTAADSPAEFPAVLDQVENAKTHEELGFDQFTNGNDSPGKRMVRMLGSPEIWDPYGSAKLRKTFIARLRKRWDAQGEGLLLGLAPRTAVPGRVEVNWAGMQIARDIEKMRRQFFLNNGRLYELGAMDGSFPPSGFMLGSQSGVWAPPNKALDAFGFVFRERGRAPWRLEDCTRFSHDFATATFAFSSNGWTVTRTDFPAAAEPSLFCRLTIANDAKAERGLDVDFVADVNIRPDWRTSAQKAGQNDLDVIESREGVVRAWDANLPRSMIVLGANQAATQIKIDDARATLTYHVTIPGGGKVELVFLIQTGLEISNLRPAAGFSKMMERWQSELESRRKRVAEQVDSGVRFKCSDTSLTEAFALAKANLVLLTADCRPHFPDVYLMAGVPVYPRLFACDSCISLPGATAAGLLAQAKGTLSCLAFQARKYKSLVPHESATDGTLIGPSNSQETTQFIATAAHYLRWTCDRRFAAELYPLLSSAMAAHRTKFARDVYPAGAALIETRGMGPHKIDAACWQYAAFVGLAEVAELLAKEQDARTWRAQAATYKAALQRDWWMPQEKMWADSLDDQKSTKLDGLWSVVFPQITEAASASQAQQTMDGLAEGWINQWGGVHTRQADISQQGSGVVTTGVFAQAAFAQLRGELGLRLLLQNAQAPRQDRMPGAFTEMIPAGGSDFAQLWSAGPFLAAVVEGLAGIRPNAAAHELELSPQLPAGLTWMTLENVRIGEHELRLDVRRQENITTTTLTHTKGPAALSIVFIPSNQQLEMNLNGKPANFTSLRINRLDQNMKVIKHAVPPAGKATFSQ